jgi:hypothetical protein
MKTIQQAIDAGMSVDLQAPGRPIAINRCPHNMCWAEPEPLLTRLEEELATALRMAKPYLDGAALLVVSEALAKASATKVAT